MRRLRSKDEERIWPNFTLGNSAVRKGERKGGKKVGMGIQKAGRLVYVNDSDRNRRKGR